VVGTPGRLAEFVRQGAVQLHRCPLLVLDEADQLLAANFVEDMGHITDHAGKKVGGVGCIGWRCGGAVGWLEACLPGVPLWCCEVAGPLLLVV
jgi:hypothetical protein